MLPPFATAAELGVRMNRTFTGAVETQVDRLLADASSLIRVAAGYQQISRVDSDTVTLRGSRTVCLTLPQRPVLGVTAVAGLAAGQWDWDGGETLTRLDGSTWCGPATVTYSHGLDPDHPGYDVARSVACDAVKRVILNPDLVRSHSVDDFAETLVDARASLLDGETETIRAAFAGASLGVL